MTDKSATPFFRRRWVRVTLVVWIIALIGKAVFFPSEEGPEADTNTAKTSVEVPVQQQVAQAAKPEPIEDNPDTGIPVPGLENTGYYLDVASSLEKLGYTPYVGDKFSKKGGRCRADGCKTVPEVTHCDKDDNCRAHFVNAQGQYVTVFVTIHDLVYSNRVTAVFMEK